MALLAQSTLALPHLDANTPTRSARTTTLAPTSSAILPLASVFSHPSVATTATPAPSIHATAAPDASTPSTPVTTTTLALTMLAMAPLVTAHTQM
jgi:hypothetical protein